MTATTSSTVRHTTAGDLRRRLAHGPQIPLLDVRTPGEYAAAHIEGSHNLPLELVRARTADIATRLQGPVTLLCASGPRSEEAARILGSHGVTGVEVVLGGIQAWSKVNNEVIRGKGTWAMERQVRLVAGSIVVAGVLGSVIAPKAKWVAAGIGGGLTFSAVSNTCGMARVLGFLPYNRRAADFDPDEALAALGTWGG